MSFSADAVAISGKATQHKLKHSDGREADRNFCAVCGGLVFGGVRGESEQYTIYAGSLDDPDMFKPAIAIFVRDKPDWVLLPSGLTSFDTMPSKTP